MNRGLLATLAVTVALSALALLRPVPSATQETPVVVASTRDPLAQVAQVSAVSPTAAVAVVEPTGGVGTAPGPLPAHWPEAHVDAATRSPFLPPQPPALKPVAKPASVVEAPPPPPLPVADYRFWGRFAGPDGKRLIYVARGNVGAPVEIGVGSKLEDGWSVESIGDNSIVLVHAASQQRSTVSIPVEAPPGQR